MRRKIRVTILTPLITVLAAAALYAPQASAVAYCALRDPAAAIQQLFPGRTTYRTFVETIGRNIRPTLATKLPFDIHFDEFGRHSFYAIFRDERPEGFVQARSELGQWGLAEIVWALDLDLKILDFVFQRNRDPAARYVESSDFKDILRGRGVDELAALLAQVELGQPAELGLPEKAVPLARTVIESAMKVIVVTGTVWEEDIKRVRALAAKAGARRLRPADPKARYCQKAECLTKTMAGHSRSSTCAGTCWVRLSIPCTTRGLADSHAGGPSQMSRSSSQSTLR
jgi:hypothetical protein